MKPIETGELKRMMDENPDLAVINVLPPETYREKHIPGTDNIPVGSPDFVQQVEKRTGGKDKPVVVYCANTECDASPKAAQALNKAGFTEVYDYEEGTKGWEEAGRELETAG